MKKPLRIGFNPLKKQVDLTTDRLTHQHVIGSSGTGKSKFLEQMMRGDLEARQGFCLIDPHGTLYENMVNHCARWGLKNEIILVNPSDLTFINGFDFFKKPESEQTSVHVENLIKATLHAWNAENADQTPTLRRTLTLIYTAMVDADLSVSNLEELLDYNAPQFRAKVISQIKNSLVRREWIEISNTKQKEFRDEFLSAKNRLFPILTSDTLKLFLGLKGKGIDLLEAMEKQKTILVNLRKSGELSSDSARFFGSILTNQLFERAGDRKRKADGKDPDPYYLYIDEMANFVPIDLANSLDETRKFGLFCILSHQRFGQTDENMMDALIANCQIKTVFGGLPAPFAKKMAEELFIGKLDPMKIKFAIYQTKHLYQYYRDKVYSKNSSVTNSYGKNKGRGVGVGTGAVSGSASSSTTGQMSLPPGTEFFGAGSWVDPTVTSISEANTDILSDMTSSNTFEIESESDSEAVAFTEGEGVSDVPGWAPIPIQELSSIQTYSMEEQLLELTQALKLQMQRHCFIKLPGKETQPLTVPFVKDHYVSELNKRRYMDRVLKRAGALSTAEADKLLQKPEENLLDLEKDQELETDSVKPKKKKKTKSLFDDLKDKLDL